MTFKDMYEQYIELEGAKLHKFKYGYLVLKEEANCLYIEHIYVAPEMREQGYARFMLSTIVKKALEQDKDILGSVSPGRHGATISLKSMLACGFELLSCEKDIIYLIKKLPKGALNG